MVTCDGSFGEIEAKRYEAPEEETIKQLKNLRKPFVVLLNTVHPYSKETKELAREKEEKYQAKVMPMNLEQLKKEDVYQILKSVLLEFPISSIGFYVPKWTETLSKDHPVKRELLESAGAMIREKSTMKDIYEDTPLEHEYISSWKLDRVSMDTGEVTVQVAIDDKY